MVKWLLESDQALVIFDEVHTIVNKPDLILKIIDLVPHVCILYSSATPLTKLKHAQILQHMG